MTARCWWTAWTVIVLCWGAVWLGAHNFDARELGACMLIAGIVLLGFWWVTRPKAHSQGRAEYLAIALTAVLAALIYRGPQYSGHLEREPHESNEQFAARVARTIALERSR